MSYYRMKQQTEGVIAIMEKLPSNPIFDAMGAGVFRPYGTELPGIPFPMDQVEEVVRREIKVPFSASTFYETVKSGEHAIKVVTRDGRNVTVFSVHSDSMPDRPVRATIEGDVRPRFWQEDGIWERGCVSPHDLLFVAHAFVDAADVDAFDKTQEEMYPPTKDTRKEEEKPSPAPAEDLPISQEQADKMFARFDGKMQNTPPSMIFASPDELKAFMKKTFMDVVLGK